MKYYYESFCHGLKFWPIFRFACVFGLLITGIEMSTLMIIKLNSGVIPVFNHINLIIWHGDLPFSISRIWDIILLPIFIFLCFLNEDRKEEDYFDSGGNDDYGLGIVTHTQFLLFATMLGASIFGALYAIPIFLIICICII